MTTLLYNHPFVTQPIASPERIFAASRNRNHRRQRAVLHARPDQSKRSSSENAFWQAFRRLCPRHTGRPQGRVSGPPRTRPPHPAHRTEFSRQHLWFQAAGRGADRFHLRRRIVEGRAQAAGVRHPRPVFRPHAPPRRHLFWKRHRGPHRLRGSDLSRAGRGSSKAPARKPE